MRTAIILLLVAAVVGLVASEDQPSCLCSREYIPVCASDSRTYANKCEFNCAKSRMVGRAADGFTITRGGECNGPEIPVY